LCGFGWWVEGMTVFVGKKADEKGQPGAKVDGLQLLACYLIIADANAKYESRPINSSVQPVSNPMVIDQTEACLDIISPRND
jgi:hypothetical protein